MTNKAKKFPVLIIVLLTEVLHLNRETIYMKHIKWDFSLKARVLSLGTYRVDLTTAESRVKDWRW